MRRYFLAGLGLLLPAVLTLVIVNFLVNLLTKPFQGLFRQYITTNDLKILGSPEFVLIVSKVIILLLIVALIVIIGFITQAYLVQNLIGYCERLIKRIPLINKIYHAIKEVMTTLFRPGSNSFAQAVLVQYPKKGCWAIGLITNTDTPMAHDKEHMNRVSVFVPGTPNPTMGFILLVKREELIFLDLPVEEAIRYVVSCGIVSSPLQEVMNPK